MKVVLRIGFVLLATVVLLVLVEGAASALRAWKDAGDSFGLAEEAHCDHDPDLGWSHRPSARFEDLYGPQRHLTTNARGFRATREYAAEVPPGRYRVVCLGDSFTLGYGVGDESTYPAKLEAARPAIQAVNMGQGGYGIDQCYLWYLRDGVALETDLLLLAFIAPDFERMLETRFQDEYPKPRLRVEEGALVLPSEPVPDAWSRSGSRRFARFAERLAVFDLLRRAGGGKRARPESAGELPYRELGALVVFDLARLSRERGQAFVLALLPLRDREAGNARAVARWLRGLSAETGVPFLDLCEDFDALPPAEVDAYYQPDGHLNALGNALLADALLRRLPAVVEGFPPE